jgi:hypothetical protein
MGSTEYESADYAKVFHSQSSKLDTVIESRLHSKATADVLDNLIDAAPEQTLRWMRQKAELADGTTPGLALVPIEAVIEAVQEVSGQDFAEAGPEWTIARRSVWAVMEVGLARQLTSDTLATISKATGQSISQVDRWTRLHTEWILAYEEYAQAASSATQVALSCWRVCCAWEEREERA